MDNSTAPVETPEIPEIARVIMDGLRNGTRRVPVDSGSLLVVDPCLLPADVLAGLIDAQHGAIVSTASDGLYEVAALGMGEIEVFLV